MLKELICLLWGHKTVHKAFTGNTLTYTDRLTGADHTAPCYRWERTPFCTRCGKDVPVTVASPTRGRGAA